MGLIVIVIVMLICIINNCDVMTSHEMYISKFKMVAHTVVEEHNLEGKSDTVHCMNKSYHTI